MVRVEGVEHSDTLSHSVGGMVGPVVPPSLAHQGGLRSVLVFHPKVTIYCDGTSGGVDRSGSVPYPQL